MLLSCSCQGAEHWFLYKSPPRPVNMWNHSRTGLVVGLNLSEPSLIASTQSHSCRSCSHLHQVPAQEQQLLATLAGRTFTRASHTNCEECQK